MTLKEKLRQNLTGHLSDEKTEVDVNIAEKIAEEFAIEFAEWISYKYKFLLDKKGWFRTTYELEMGIFISSQELLEIYKKEQTNKCQYCGLENGNHKLSCPVIRITMMI